MLMYDFEDEDGEYRWTGTTFLETIAFKQTVDDKINVFQIKAYNAVAEVADSEWINEFSLHPRILIRS
ncbi:hypothetical protein [Desulfosporosinus sp. BICA1-9]|uniref:hypothetical protein n=1 Tax=Desulfosporosinus sp. BICA1-9 TaxID=1531958 RepID=UPI0025C72187|nr:hypothetical protein [Desulfosporosinus sp. BICA1-9]